MSDEAVKLFAVEYEHKGSQYKTVVEAVSAEAAAHQFRRENPHVDFLACYCVEEKQVQSPPEVVAA